MGRLGNISGTYSCTVGTTAANAGSFSISNIESGRRASAGAFPARPVLQQPRRLFSVGVRDVL
jgi:hypothetical protein